MADPLNFTVTGMPASGTRNADSPTELRFATVEGPLLILKFDAEQIDRFAVRAHQTSVLARIQKLATTGHAEFHGEAVASLEVAPAVGGSGVQLFVSMPNQALIPYGLTLNQARTLLADLDRAIAEAGDDAGQTRQ